MNHEITHNTVGLMKKAHLPPFERTEENAPLTSLRPCFFSVIKLFGLLLSAVTASLHYLPRCLRPTVTGGKIPIAAT